MSVLEKPTIPAAQWSYAGGTFAASPPGGLPECAGAALSEEHDQAPITVGDVLGWPESPLALAEPWRRATNLERCVGAPALWRSSAPPTQPGALVLVPGTTLRHLGARLPGAVAALSRSRVAALIVEPGTALDLPDHAPPLLRARGRIDEESTNELTQLLLARRGELYRRRYALERSLADSALGGQPRADLLRLGAVHLVRKIFLLDERGSIVEVFGVGRGQLAAATLTPPPPPVTTSGSLAQVAGADGATRWLFARLAGEADTPGGGWLAIGKDAAPPDEGDRLILARLAAVYRTGDGRRARADRGAMVAELLRRACPPEARAEIAASLRLKPAGAFAVVRLAAPATADADWPIARALERAASGAQIRAEVFASPAGDPVGLLLHAGEGDRARLGDAIEAIRDDLRAAHPGVLAAVGGATSGLGRLPQADAEARYALALLRAGLIPGPLVDWGSGEDLGHFRPFYPLWGTPLASGFVGEILGPLLERDARQVEELLQTLLAYVRHAGNNGATASALGIHRNTLSYRLRQVEQFTGRSPHDPSQLLSLLVAALLWTLPAPQDEGEDRASPAARGEVRR